jgi:hypothetical protein
MLSVFALVAALSAPIGDPAAERFDVGADATSCSVYRQVTVGTTPTLVGVRHFPGEAGATLMLSVPPEMAIGGRQMKPTFTAAGLSIGAIEVARTSAGAGVYIIPVRASDGTSLDKLGTVSLRGLAREPVAVDFEQVTRMVRAGAECERGLLAGWGVAPDGPMSVVRPPAPRSDTWISFVDVPDRYIDKANGRFTTILWSVAPNGKIGECRVIDGSGDAGFDELACPALRRKIGYTRPALDGAGRPVEAVMVRRIRWGPIE